MRKSQKSEIKVPPWSGEDPLPGHRLLVSSHLVEGARELYGVSFIRALIPFLRALPLQPRHLPKALPPNTVTVGIRIPT